MAIIPSSKYPGQVATDATNYPHGKARNVTVSGDGTGTPFEAALVNDIFGFQQALLAAASIAPSNNPDTAVASQYLDALRVLFRKQLLDAGNITEAAVISGSTLSTTPTVIGSHTFSVEVNDQLKIDVGPLKFSHDVNGVGGYVMIKMIEEGGSPETVEYTRALIDNATHYESFPILYTVQETGTLTLQVSIGSDGTHTISANSIRETWAVYTHFRP